MSSHAGQLRARVPSRRTIASAPPGIVPAASVMPSVRVGALARGAAVVVRRFLWPIV
jgi:hypothetical protein